jgi:hypothetical protein
MMILNFGWNRSCDLCILFRWASCASCRWTSSECHLHGHILNINKRYKSGIHQLVCVVSCWLGLCLWHGCSALYKAKPPRPWLLEGWIARLEQGQWVQLSIEKAPPGGDTTKHTVATVASHGFHCGSGYLVNSFAQSLCGIMALQRCITLQCSLPIVAREMAYIEALLHTAHWSAPRFPWGVAHPSQMMLQDVATRVAPVLSNLPVVHVIFNLFASFYWFASTCLNHPSPWILHKDGMERLTICDAWVYICKAYKGPQLGTLWLTTGPAAVFHETLQTRVGESKMEGRELEGRLV